MITQEQQKQGVELMNSLVEKAWNNAEFKEQLIKNPVATIESVTGHKLNDNVNFIVEDQSDSSKIFLNIPRKVELDSLELSDEQLEMVNGGEFVVAIAVGGAFLTGMGIGVAIYAAVND